MPLTTEDTLNNITIVSDLVNDAFRDVVNKEELKEIISTFVNNNEISLQIFSGEVHRNLLIDAIRKSILQNRYEAELAIIALETFKRELYDLDLAERETFLNQAPEAPGIIRQLQEKGYVEGRHQLTHEDITQIFDRCLIDPQTGHPVAHSDPISVTENVEVLKQILSENTASVLYIPTNINRNHWVLIKLERTSQGTNFKCWDSLYGTQETVKTSLSELMQNLTEAVTEVYPHEAVDIKYEFANEQNDGFACGHRIAQKAMKDIGIDNNLTRVPTNRADQLHVETVKLLASKEPSLAEAANHLNVVVQENLVIPYRNDENYQNRDQLKAVIKHKKETQEEADRLLAIALQEVYLSNSNRGIDTDRAMQLAKQKLQRTNVNDLNRIGQKLKTKLLAKEKEFVANKNMTANPETISRSRGITPRSAERTISSTMPFFSRTSTSSRLSSNCRVESEENSLTGVESNTPVVC